MSGPTTALRGDALTEREVLANELYVAVVNPDLTWWDDLPPEMQEGWLRAADKVLAIEAEARAQGALHEHLATEGDIERALATYREQVSNAIDVGIYPQSSPYGERTPWQDGWNAACIAITEALDALTAVEEEPR